MKSHESTTATPRQSSQGKSSESKSSLSQAGRALGSVTSAKKAETSRENGMKGGEHK